jgi:Flp pilus assembly pilin Flp
MSHTLLRLLLARLRETDGQTMVEYALLAFLLSVVSIIFLAAIGLDIAEWMDAVENALGLGASNTVSATPGTDDAATAAGVNP